MKAFANLKNIVEKIKSVKNEKYLWVLLFAFFLFLRVYKVGSDISNSDAARWHRRSINFLQAVKSGDFKNTYQHYQPGVTIMLLNAPLKQTATSFQRYILNRTPKTLENADYYPLIHGLSKVQINIVLAGLLAFQAFLISQLFNKNTAFVYVLLISAEPYLVGIDRWFHLTSMETYFSFSALLSLIYWLHKEKPKFLYISAALFSLAVLSKLTSLILGPVLLAILVTSSCKNLSKKRKFKSIIQHPIIKYGLTFLGITFVLFPALWVSPFEVLQNLYNAIFNAVASDGRSRFFNAVLNWVYYPVVLGFKLSPITLILFAVSLFGLRSSEHKIKWFLWGFLSYLLFLTLSDKKIDRYTLVFFPYIILLASVYISTFSSRNFRLALLAGVSYSLLVYFIYLSVNSAYYSPLFGGSSGVLNFGVYENSGEYFAQAADYLNDRGRDKVVWVPNNVESFNYYYKGRVVRDYTSEVDYVVSS